MKKQMLISIRDLRFATLVCTQCETRVTLDFASQFQPASGPRPFEPPQKCPQCGQRYDSNVPDAIKTLHQVYRALAGVDVVTFTTERSAE